jgi:ribose transport system substrate-binding protein
VLLVPERREPYLIKSVVHASEVLRVFQSRGEALRLRDVIERTGYNKAVCFRLLHTLRHCGLIEKVDDSRYRLTSDVYRRRRYRIGYAALDRDSSFQVAVEDSLRWVAESENVELIVLDNRRNAKTALRNAEWFVREKVDLVIEFQIDEAVASTISARYLEASVPFIAVHVPHPGGTYYGANNYQAGLLAGHYLGRWAKTRWNGQVDEVLLIDARRAGSLVHGRIAGLMAGLKESLRETTGRAPISTIDGDGQFKLSLEQTRRYLRRLDPARKRILVGAVNDSSALGAVRAFQEAGRAANCAIVGQNAEPAARAELRVPRTPLIGSVAYFPEKYGEELISLAFDILAHRPTPPARFVKHQVLTAANLDHFYPNDALLAPAPTPTV